MFGLILILEIETYKIFETLQVFSADPKINKSRYFRKNLWVFICGSGRCSAHAVRDRSRCDIGTIINSKFLVINL